MKKCAFMVNITVNIVYQRIISAAAAPIIIPLLCESLSIAVNAFAYYSLIMQKKCNQNDVKKLFKRSDEGLSRIDGAPSSAITP